MATVYLARDPKLNRPVAIKVLRPELSDLLGRERFLREIEIVAGLQHPNILPLHDSGATDGLLYYVMPYVAGESLRDRLDREKQLPIEDALRICREIADALSCAHAQGIVHRDIKPANVLLGEGHALVADFGIARMVSAEDATQLTERGIAVGTPAYMSPEQASGQDPVDGRTDLYALGCVLYEMLAGEPPFSGPTTQAILARHRFDPVPPLRSVRPSVPTGVEGAILHALEKVPADRFATTAQFVEALARVERRRSWLPRTMWIPLGLTAAAAIVWAAWRGISGLSGVGGHGGPGPDSSRYVILPFEHDSSVTAALSENQLLHDALTRWTGIAVVDPFQVRDAIARRGGRLVTSNDALEVAAGLGAGRYVRGEVSRIGDSVRVHAGLYDATRRGGPPLRERAVRLPLDFSRAESSFADLGDGLLFGIGGPGSRLEGRTGTSSFPARREFARGLDSIYSWNLPAADSAFSVATRLDQSYAQAFVWVAQARSWMAQGRSWANTTMATWQSAAERAAAGRARLSSRDQLLSDALLALSRMQVQQACRTWTRLTRLDPFDFATWYGLGNCLSRDDAVLRDPVSPSGWRFRSSYHQATSAYVRAFQLLPSIHRSLRAGSYEVVRRLLMTSGSQLRSGRAVPPDTTTFAARPSLYGDTLTFLPYPQEAIARPSWHVPGGVGLAVRRERELFRDITVAWVTAYPKSADAVAGLAISLEMLGDPSALDTLRRARALATTPAEGIRLAGEEVWMRLRLSVPTELAGLGAARRLADSLLHANPPGAPEPILLAGLAELTGHAALAAAHSRHTDAVAGRGVPTPLAGAALPFLAFAALGGPADSLQVLGRQVDSVIENVLAMPSRRRARLEWLARPTTLVFPRGDSSLISRLSGAGDFLLDAQQALVRGDSVMVRQLFATLRESRRLFQPEDIAPDALYPEAFLLSALGDSREAINWLDPTLSAFSRSSPDLFADLPQAGALVRAMALRAELAERVAEHQAGRRWAAAVVVLWSDADPFLQPIVRQMRRLAG